MAKHSTEKTSIPNSQNTPGGDGRQLFLKIEHDVFRQLLRIPPAAAMLWLQHKMHQGANGASWCSLETICDEMQWNKDTVCKWRKWLIEHHWLVAAGEREKNSGTFAVRMFSAVIGEAPLPKPSEVAKRDRIRNLGKWYCPNPYPKPSEVVGPKPSEVAVSQALGQEVDSKKQVDSYEEEKPSPSEFKKSCDSQNENGPGDMAPEKSDFPLAEKKPSKSKTAACVENETLTLPACILAPDANPLVLTPPKPNGADPRTKGFRDAIYRMWDWAYRDNPQPWGWDERDAAQLKRVLETYPALDLDQWQHWLLNYAKSYDHPRGERPFRFLPRMDVYSVEAIDKFRHGASARTYTVKDEGIMRQRQAAAEARRSFRAEHDVLRQRLAAARARREEEETAG